MKTNNYFKFGLLLEGIILMGMGCYFIFFRPPLLPEDYRYIGTSNIEINNHIPGLTFWLKKVFIVLGGYIVSAGSLMLYLGISQKKRTISSLIVILVSGLSSTGLMTAINFFIDSDFKWMLLAFTLPWTLSIASYFRSDTEASIKTF